MQEQLLALMDERFKYKMGDVVAHVGHTFGSDEKSLKPQRLVVVERCLWQCHGGVQQMYHVRVCTHPDSFREPGFLKEYTRVSETELVAYPVGE